MKFQATYVNDTEIGINVSVYEAQRILGELSSIEEPSWPVLDLKKTLREGLTKAAERMQEHGKYLQEYVLKEDDQ